MARRGARSKGLAIVDVIEHTQGWEQLEFCMAWFCLTGTKLSVDGVQAYWLRHGLTKQAG